MGQWLRLRPDPWVPPPFSAGPPLFLNCAGRRDLGEALVRLIASAQKSLALVSPILDAEWVIAALLTARQRHVRVRIITELRENRGKGIVYPTRGIDISSDAAPLPQHFAATRRLAAQRVFCRGLTHYAHAKLVIADEAQVLVSSANLSDNSLGWGTAPSVEAGLWSDDPRLAAAWSGAFAELWDACPFRLNVAGREISLQQVAVHPSQPFLAARPVGEHRTLTWTWPPGQRGLRDWLVAAVRGARQRLLFAALSFYDLDRITGLLPALEQALDRGVQVTAVVRPEHFRPKDYPDPATQRLVQRGLRLLGITGLHVKGVLADRQWVGLMSANVNPFSLDSTAESAQVECGLVGEIESPLLEPYAQLLEQLVATATHEYRLG